MMEAVAKTLVTATSKNVPKELADLASKVQDKVLEEFMGYFEVDVHLHQHVSFQILGVDDGVIMKICDDEAVLLMVVLLLSQIFVELITKYLTKNEQKMLKVYNTFVAPSLMEEWAYENQDTLVKILYHHLHHITVS